MGGLFTIAWWGDRTRLYPQNSRLRAPIYSLALAVYCSSWTFYGAVGSAVRDGLAYLPIYLGPMFLSMFALPFFERLVRIAKHQNVTSISDLLSAPADGEASKFNGALLFCTDGIHSTIRTQMHPDQPPSACAKGTRRVVPIVGGLAQGPRFNGRILAALFSSPPVVRSARRCGFRFIELPNPA